MQIGTGKISEMCVRETFLCDEKTCVEKMCIVLKSRTTDIQRELFFKNWKLLGLGRQIGLKFYEAFGVFLAKL